MMTEIGEQNNTTVEWHTKQGVTKNEQILAAKVQQKKIKAADARALLDKYGAKSVSALDPQYFDAVLEEASSM